jgi:hypothetical protein
MESSEPHRQAGKERKCIDSEREQQPAEEAEAENAENDADGHGGSP